MGKGVVREDHPLLLGMTGFWGTPIANEKCRTADVILAVGTRFAEANSSSWDPRFTFNIPPTRLIHIDADVAEIGRNFPTELGRRRRREAGAGGAGRARRAACSAARRGALRARDRAGPPRPSPRTGPTRYSSSQYPMRPERILSELRKAVPENGYIVTDVGWNKNGVGQQFPITVPGTFITPSGLATMGFGPAAALGVKLAQPDRAVVALIGDGAFGSNPSVVATAMEAGLGVVWLVMDNAAFGTIAGLTNMHYGWEFGCLFEADGARYRTDFAQMAKGYGADGVFIHVGRRARTGAERRARVGTADRHPGADGERADADAGPLGHQLRLSKGQLSRPRRLPSRDGPPHPRALGADPRARRRRHDDQLPRSDGARHRRAVPDEGSRAHGDADGAGVLRLLVELRARCRFRAASSSIGSARGSPTSSPSSCWSLFTGLMGVVNSLGALIATRIGVGVFEAPCFPANSRILATWFPQHERARANSIYSVGQNVGLGFLSVPLFWITQQFGWRGLFFIVGGLGIVVRRRLVGAVSQSGRQPDGQPRRARLHRGRRRRRIQGAAAGVQVAPHRRAAAAPPGHRRVDRTVRRQLDAGLLRHVVSDLPRHARAG